MPHPLGSMLIGDKIALIRKANGLSQEACSQRLGISRSAYQHYERNEHDVPASVIKKFCDEFEVDSTWLLFGDGEARINERNRGILEISRFLLAFVEQRARETRKDLPEEKKWEVVNFIAADFWGRRAEIERIAKDMEKRVDDIIYMMAA